MSIFQMIFRLILMSSAVILFTRCQAPSPEPTPWQPTVEVDTIMSSPDYGMHVFLYWHEEVADRDLKLVEEAQFRWVKQTFPWRELEGAGKGIWNWTAADRMVQQIENHHLKTIARLGMPPDWATPPMPDEAVSPPRDLQDFYEYVYAVASRYQGRIQAYQVWNEPNLAREWGNQPPDPVAYTRMLQVAYQAIKAADPQAIVISAGLAPTTRNDALAMPDIYFFEGMYQAGASAYFDALGVNAAGFKSPPWLDPAEVAQDPIATNGDSGSEELKRVYAFRHVEDVRALMEKHGDAAKKIVILEFGWTVEPRRNSPYYWHAVDRIEQAVYFEEAYRYAVKHWQPWIGVMSLIYVADPAWNEDMEETYWSIVYPFYPEARVAPAYEGLKKLEKIPSIN